MWRSTAPNRTSLAGLAVFALLLALFLGYGALSTWAMTHAPDRPWTVAVLFGPLVAGLAIEGWLRRHAVSLAASAALALGLALVVARGGVGELSRLYVLQHACVHAALAWCFGRTLRAGATPLITAMAERVHTVFTPTMREYTRGLTLVWAVYFVAMIALSLAVYAFAPWSWWSLFCNVFTPAAAVGLFFGERVLRHWRHPEFERVSIAQALRAFQTVPR
jgi:uncharacterized membrane protein